MTKYVKINDGTKMHGAALEHGRVYSVEQVSLSTGLYMIIDAAGRPYEFARSEVTEVSPEDMIAEESATLAAQQKESDPRFHEYVEPEVDEAQDDSLWAALNLEPNPRQKMFLVKHVKNPDAPTMEELGEAQDISGYTSTFEFTLGDWKEPEEDVVNAPNHYSEGVPGEYEVIDIILAQGWEDNWYMGSAIKYLLRAQYKGAYKQDLRKAIKMIEWELARTEDADV